MAASKGPPPKQPKVDLDDLVKQWEADKKSRLFLQLAEAYRKQDAIDAALSVLREGLKHHPAFAPAHVALARCLMAKGQLAQAQAELEPICKKAPDNLLAGKLLAQVLHERGERQRALSMLQKLSVFAPDDEEIADRIATLKGALGGGAPKSESGDTAEFSTSDYTGEGSRAKPPASAMPSAGMTPAPVASRWAPVAARAPEPPVAESDDVVEIVADEAPPDDQANADDEANAADAGLAATGAMASAGLPDMPRPATSPDDLLGAPLANRDEDSDDEFTSITLAELYEGQGGHDEAARIYEKLLRQRPADASLQRALERCRAAAAGTAAPTPARAAPLVPAPSPPPRPRWEPVRPRAVALIEEDAVDVPEPAAGATSPLAFARVVPRDARLDALRAERRMLKRFLLAVQAVRTAR